ncbi:U3 snoRNP protein [Ophidiomyces ophidiicola]|nr:U3 snoRNP protein [Ophidiomyces ophidiicola]KAI1999848.1 U3 snoRNP protein [Ophidiomyces ophidiicola]KAI2013628.1 U3 snoRNP protein [Ophidiomyces ophidiicola]KAI2015698.1 U3 snoRNP protein [Ophidiomyces ophidiicola]KAI2065679.1 U3 snoRNP protein [Ophidiomyces ophidiicola]
MAAASDKARFYLEQSIPELKEFEKKKIFSKDEIASITKRRSEFEHRVNARGPSPADFARYAEYEMNLDTLWRKRIKRLGIKAPAHSGQRRIFFILDRATRKFHGDLSLWMQYIAYTRKQRAHKKLSQIFTSALRLHPKEVELWILAARCALEDHAEMTLARGYMQRGLRFCKNSRALWLQYAKLEMIYIARIAARQKILGLDKEAEGNKSNSSNAAMEMDTPQLTCEDINPTLEKDEVDKTALEALNSTPALSGAIPIAIFDTAMKQFNDDDHLGLDFYKIFAEFQDTPCLKRVLTHVVEHLMEAHATSPHSQICYIRLPVEGIKLTTPQYPQQLAISLSRLREYSSTIFSRDLAEELITWLTPLLSIDDLDPALRQVIEAILGRAVRTMGLTTSQVQGT